MKKITVYEKPTCSTCKNVSKILKEMGVEFEKINYYIDPFTKEELIDLIKKMKMKPEELLRKSEVAYKELDMANRLYTENELLDYMVNNPDLVQRPIVVVGNKAILARPAEKIKELFQ